MASWLPSVPYPPAREGYWAPVTSTLDWCEENYYATEYSAEVVNAFTNLLFLYLGLKGIRNCLTQGHDTVFLVSFLGYLIVGSGSFLFHSTLKYPMQLVDELSMIYTTCIMVFATFGYRKSTVLRVALTLLLIALSVFITGYYHYVQEPTFHQVSYALLTATVLLRAMYIMEVNIRPSLRHKRTAVGTNGSANGSAKPKQKAEQARQDERDLEILRKMWIMIAYGLSIFLGGFAIWNLDNAYCSKLRGWRHQVGLPWGIALEGHGWWHLMTGLGAYYYIVWGIWLRHCLNGDQDHYKLVWNEHVFSIPEVVGSEQVTNGSAYKHTSKKHM